MKTIELPKTKSVIDSITFDDCWIYPDYIIDKSSDPSYYNDEHIPIMRLQEPYYNAKKYQKIIEIKEEARKKYEEWISKAPWFVNVVIS